MIRIAISRAAYDAIAQTFPFRSVGYETGTDERGERYVRLDPAVVDVLRPCTDEARATARPSCVSQGRRRLPPDSLAGRCACPSYTGEQCRRSGCPADLLLEVPSKATVPARRRMAARPPSGAETGCGSVRTATATAGRHPGGRGSRRRPSSDQIADRPAKDGPTARRRPFEAFGHHPTGRVV